MFLPASVFMYLVRAAQWQLCFPEIWVSSPTMGLCCRPFGQHGANTWYSGGLADHTLQSDNLLFPAKKEKKNKKENGCLIFHYCVFLDEGKKKEGEKKPFQLIHLKWHNAGGQIRRKQRKAIRLSITRGTGGVCVWGLHTNEGQWWFWRDVWPICLGRLNTPSGGREIWSQNKMGGLPGTIGWLSGSQTWISWGQSSNSMSDVQIKRQLLSLYGIIFSAQFQGLAMCAKQGSWWTKNILLYSDKTLLLMDLWAVQ